jgi:hypothetical protein
LGGLLMTNWEASLGYTVGFIGMCIGAGGVAIIAVVASRVNTSANEQATATTDVEAVGHTPS